MDPEKTTTGHWVVKSRSGLKLTFSKEKLQTTNKESSGIEFTSVGTQSNTDWLMWLFEHNFHRILEKIIFALTPKLIRLCKEVSPAWCQLILHFHESGNPRIQQIIEKRLNHQWGANNPILAKVPIPKITWVDKYFDMISDDEHIFVGVGDKAIHSSVIIALRLEGLEPFKYIVLSKYFHQSEHNGWTHLNLTLTKEYLVLTGIRIVGEKRQQSLLQQQFSILAWDRKNNLNYMGLQRVGSFPSRLFHRFQFIMAFSPKVVMTPVIDKTGMDMPIKIIKESGSVFHYKIDISPEDNFVIIRTGRVASRISYYVTEIKLWYFYQ